MHGAQTPAHGAGDSSLTLIYHALALQADGSTSLTTLQKARLSYGQRVLGLVDASTDKILAEQNAIKLYISAVDRASGKKVDPRSSGANKIVALAKVRLRVNASWHHEPEIT